VLPAEKTPTIKSANGSSEVKFHIRELMKAYPLIVGVHAYL